MSANEERTIWLSGAILTALNKLILPAVWSGVLVAVPLGVFAETGRLSIQKGFGFFVAAVLLATVFLAWMTLRLHRVGYSGGDLVVSNYWRRIIYYLPRWAPLRCFCAAPEKELREILGRGA